MSAGIGRNGPCERAARPPRGNHCRDMTKSVVNAGGRATGRRELSAVSALIVEEHDREVARIAIPRPEIQLIVRFGPSARNEMDVHAFGPQQTVLRKRISLGRAVTARLCFGTARAVFGVPSFALTGQILALEELWGERATQRFSEELVAAHSTMEAADIVERTISQRYRAHPRPDSADLVDAAAMLLAKAGVKAVAAELGVSERHLRRVFREAVGVGPKTFAKLAEACALSPGATRRTRRAGRKLGEHRPCRRVLRSGAPDRRLPIHFWRHATHATRRTLRDLNGPASLNANSNST